MIQFSCPVCGKKHQARDELAGREALCHQCKQRMPIPAPAPPQVPANPLTSITPLKAGHSLPNHGRDGTTPATPFPCPACMRPSGFGRPRTGDQGPLHQVRPAHRNPAAQHQPRRADSNLDYRTTGAQLQKRPGGGSWYLCHLGHHRSMRWCRLDVEKRRRRGKTTHAGVPSLINRCLPGSYSSRPGVCNGIR